uniref:Uncharacterized protein TCIL3000_11_10750 n=1 Tax=Trypanosoma congolense (strain IL3000) TaxID=1068625 RepID=G0V1S7_TRYCI|nr:unnamed protein product [Trypanosoma congolense IL3000]
MSIREEWHRLVDEVSAIDSTDPLPQEFVASDFLPSGRGLSAELLNFLRSGAAAFEAEAATLFQPQISVEEGFHAAPISTRCGATRPLRSLANDRSEGVSAEAHRLPRHEGPNFYEAYLSHTTAASRSRDNNNPPLSSATLTANNLRPIGNASRLASGFLVPEYYAQKHRQLDFTPIILITASVSSALQMFNISDFLERGSYVEPSTRFVDPETGEINVRSKPDTVIVKPGSFLDPDKYTVAYKEFCVLDDPRHVKNWDHVCACIVDGNEWQFRHWFPGGATQVPVSQLFQRVCGFLPYFEEDMLPKALQEWHVKPLKLTRRVVKSHAHILQASVFWEHLYTFLETHTFFKLYTVPAA